MAANSQMCLLFLVMASTTAVTTVYDFMGSLGFQPVLLPDSVRPYYILKRRDSSVAFGISLMKECYVQYNYMPAF